jgi:hypothetical protein
MTDQQRPEFSTVSLEDPIKRGDGEIAELTLRRPRAGELRGLSLADVLKMETGAVAKLLPRISNPPIIDAEVEQLDPADLFACAVEIASFFMTREELAASRTT